MAFQARHRWIIHCLQSSLGFNDEIEVEKLMTTNQIMEQLDTFFQSNGADTIFFYYQSRVESPEDSLSSSSEDQEGNHQDLGTEDFVEVRSLKSAISSHRPFSGTDDAEKQLFITSGETDPLLARAVYFIKNDPESVIDPASAEDNALSFGVLDPNALLSMETMLSQVFKPILENQTEEEWGQAERSATFEFLDGMDGFIDELQESLKSMTTGLELRKPDRKYEYLLHDDARHVYAMTDEAVMHLTSVLSDWCSQVDVYVEEQDQSRWETNGVGPHTELEYWKRRLQRLMGIMEQIKTKEFRAVIGVLTAMTKPSSASEQHGPILSVLRTWKQIDNHLTEAANEAKDNVKYLSTLDKFIEPLYSGTVQSVIDSLPALINAVKMVHTIARYYNTTERMTNLFMKISNQMIHLCKISITGGNDRPSSSSGSTTLNRDTKSLSTTTSTASLNVKNQASQYINDMDLIWNRSPESLLLDLESCLQLNETYQETYRLTKDKLLTMPKGKQFDFSETQIFGTFDLFCRRLIKLMDMFSTIKQFKKLGEYEFEGMGHLLETFDGILLELKTTGHDLLDYHSTKFDRDYVDFNGRISDLEASLQHYINQSFENITSIEQSLQLFKQFQTILQREALRNDLDSKFMIIFQNYGIDLSMVQDLYEKYRSAPPVARNLSPVAGNILWSRNLLQRIEEPMRKFEDHPNVLATRDSKRIIRTYNKVAKTLVAFEYLWYEAWCKSIETAKAGLHATLIIRHPENKKLFVNFDKEILQLIREAKTLNRMGIDIPESAKSIMLQEDKFKMYYNELSYMLCDYDRIVAKIIPVTKDLLKSHLLDLEHKLRPGMMTLTWTSMNIEAYKTHVYQGLQRFEELVHSINDIIENRIDNNLKMISQSVLVDLPTDQSFALDDFVRAQERHVTLVTNLLSAKNTLIENAVEDVVNHIQQYSFDSLTISAADIPLNEFDHLKDQYKQLMYHALLNCTKQSLTAIKKRVCSRGGSGFLFLERPFFEVDVQLSVPSVRLSPSLADIQRAINRSAVAVLKCSKNIYLWGQQEPLSIPRGNETDSVPVFSGEGDDETQVVVKRTFFEKLGCDTEIIKNAILLTGALHGTKNQVHQYLAQFKIYDWLWKEDKEFRYNQFMQRNPTIQDFENELKRFMQVEAEINRIAPVHCIAALSLNTRNLKLQLTNECRQWKVQYSDRVHQQARAAMVELMDYIRLTTGKLSTSVESLDSLRYVMYTLKEVRERESSIETEISPISDMYEMLEQYLPGGYIDKEEMDQKSIIRSSWRKLVDYAEDVTDALGEVQGKFKKQLMKDVKDFQSEVLVFQQDYAENGPMVSGLKPADAVARLHRFKDELMLRERKLDVYGAGEELFALRTTIYPELVQVKKELTLLDELYGLYMDVIKTLEQYRNLLWSELPWKIDEMTSTIDSFDMRCKRMPKRLHGWEAYGILQQDIENYKDILPLIQNLSKTSMKARHWREIQTLLSVTELSVEQDSFQLSQLLATNILECKDDVDYVCESADRELQIETKLNQLSEFWDRNRFEFIFWRSGDVPIIKSSAQILEDLEEAQLKLQTMLGMRHVVPFRELVQQKLDQISDTTDTLELWMKVQTLWMSLESVFTGGDIAKQMPVEAKKFAKIDKTFLKLMQKAGETKQVVGSCANELTRHTLPILYDELEKCQKSLKGYLEQKRNKFPRFYFVSNVVLLQILSHGSDLLAVQQHYEKVFDSIDQVVYHTYDKKQIMAFKSLVGQDEEVIPLRKPVMAEGNIESWLLKLENEMQLTMKSYCESAAEECCAATASTLLHSSFDLRAFVGNAFQQISLLGIQFLWTFLSQDALTNCKTVKTIMVDTAKYHSSILHDLSSWCLEELKTKLDRTKLETLITIQVHQRDCFANLAKLHKERKLQDQSDFEWLKQTRFYWRPSQSDRHGSGACVISICDVDFKYSFEYLGCDERLVITPLTDRCYITLSQALGMHLGGAPAGPAGTGKTETVKDLGRALGIYVVVTNCTDQQRYTDMAKIFKGLCQAGLWGCFDEFNRIELPVLSVVAQQVLAITNAKRIHAPSFCFPGDTQLINLKSDVGYFITMNPGYQGRQELPENLKALFRNVAMMAPDREIIMKVRLCSAGYTHFQELAHKFTCLYALCEEQLSKQQHYDFGLRNILSVLRTAAKVKRAQAQVKNESWLLMKTLRDMNLSKLVAQDIPLFLSLLQDLFPTAVDTKTSRASAVEPTSSIHSTLQDVIAQSVELVPYAPWEAKIIQLHETTLVRHGTMLVGPAAVGKSEILRTLLRTLTQITNVQHKHIRMNPKSIRAEEMFGETDKLSEEWVDGVFASMWHKFNDRARKDHTWIVCDGPVDALWIENLNTVLDDNKILTLANGDRMPMTDNCKLIFEVEDLRNASPATVSRAGIIYVSESDLHWSTIVQGWLKKQRQSQNLVLETQHKFISQSLHKLIEAGSNNTEDEGKQTVEAATTTLDLFTAYYRNCKPLVYKNPVCLMESCLALLEGLVAKADFSTSHDDLQHEVERLVIFSLTWALGGLLLAEDRLVFNTLMVSRTTNLPPLFTNTSSSSSTSLTRGSSSSGGKTGKLASSGSHSASSFKKSLTLFDYHVNFVTLEWEKWDVPAWTYPKAKHREDVQGKKSTFKEPPKVNFAQLIVRTIDSVCATYLLQHLHHQRQSVLMMGSAGTTKTTVAECFFDRMLQRRGNSMTLKRINFSSATRPGMFQSFIEGQLDKRGGKTFGPPGGKQMTVFLDDLSMPDVNEWGDQPTLECVRQLLEHHCVCFLGKDKRGEIKVIEDVQYIGAMTHSGKDMRLIPNRLARQFFIFNMIEPSNDTIDGMFSPILRGRFDPFVEHEEDPVVSNVLTHLTTSMIEMWTWMRKNMLPTPQKFHYGFNLRDCSRIVQGILHAPLRTFTKTSGGGSSAKLEPLALVQCWHHELERVLSDKLTTLEDKAHFRKHLGVVCDRNLGKLVPHAKEDLHQLVYVTFLRDAPVDEHGQPVADPPLVYERAPSLGRVKTRVQDLLVRHLESEHHFNSSVPTKLILFEDALLHLVRIARVLSLERGSMMLVGVGGSGKQSLTRLACVLVQTQLFQIVLTKAYNLLCFSDDLRALYRKAGLQNQSVTFLLTDAEIKHEEMLDYLNSILMTGEVSNLFTKDELNIMGSKCREDALAAGVVDSPENLVKFFIHRVRDNLHVILSLSPMHPKFAERCRRFPALLSGCVIDWFLPWPEEALITVSQGILDNFSDMECSESIKSQLILHMARVHTLVMNTCQQYFRQLRRHTYQTPKSYLSFLSSYEELYTAKLADITKKETNINLGLQKLIQGAADVEQMKVGLKEDEKKLIEAESAANAMLGNLERKSMEAKTENDLVQKIKEKCESDAREIKKEKDAAEEDLANAQPYLEEAERAVSSIRPNDLTELKKLAKPGDIIKLIFDCVAILRKYPLVKTERNSITLGIGKEKKTLNFILDSFPTIRTGMLSDARFLQQIFHFSKHEKDQINEETIELMSPYLELEGFIPAVAKNASKAAEGLCCWVRAMAMYYDASKMVKPKLEKLQLAEGRLEAAEAELNAAEKKLVACQDVLNQLQDDFEARMADKTKIEQNALATRKKMEQATALITGLAGERQRWSEDSAKFAERRANLIGDCVLASAFVSYCGAFNRAFRDALLQGDFISDLKKRKIPHTKSFNLQTFLIDQGTISDWNVEGLPTDTLSIQNGILVNYSSRYPLLIDPQGQALNWVLSKEQSRLPYFGPTSMSHTKLKDQLEVCISEGQSLVIQDVEHDVDPILNPVLEKQYISRAKSTYLQLGDKLVEVSPNFRLFLATRVANPHFNPELQARTTVVDFTVTRQGLEDQLLGRVIQKEHRALEEQSRDVQLELSSNTKSLWQLDALLLERLTANVGNLLDDLELIGVLADTKAKATEVNEKLVAAEQVQVGIQLKREQYRPVATRGSVLYFSIVTLAQVNCMYQTSLDQFLTLFELSMDVAEVQTLSIKRVSAVISTCTHLIVRYIRRGLFESDKLTFVLIVLCNILETAQMIRPADVMLFLKAGAALEGSTARPNTLFPWLPTSVWLNLIALSTDEPFFADLLDDLEQNPETWQRWFEENEPETVSIPTYQQAFDDHPTIITHDWKDDKDLPNATSSAFLRLLLIRCFREDRTILAVKDLIRATETIFDTSPHANTKQPGMSIPGLGPRYVDDSLSDTTEDIVGEMSWNTPVVYILSPGAEPTENLESTARKLKRRAMSCVSMGDGQDPVALKALNAAMMNGSWLLLQNGHLGLAFIETIVPILRQKDPPGLNPDFRLFITAEPHVDFPISVLHQSTKVTNEPPSGLRAGLLRSYTALVDQDKLERVDSSDWRTLLFSLCFLHSIVQERRKFGSLGWCIPYEFNVSDLSASMAFLEKHLYSQGTNAKCSWPTLQYMVAEVQYGGRITEDQDRTLFNTYVQDWLNPLTCRSTFRFNTSHHGDSESLTTGPSMYDYTTPDRNMWELDDYQKFIEDFPQVDRPEIFGLHPNADLTYRVKEVTAFLDMILETRPTSSQTTSSPLSREESVLTKVREFLTSVPPSFDLEETQMFTPASHLGPRSRPLNIFLMQELRSLNQVLHRTRLSLVQVEQAVKGQVAMTDEVQDTIQSIYDAKVPHLWMYRRLSSFTPNISWVSSTLGIWFRHLIERQAQLQTWLESGRPHSYWISGFFNPSGFLTAMTQEVTRCRASSSCDSSDGWQLDQVELHAEVTDFEQLRQIRQSPKEGVFVHGLSVDGASWSRDTHSLVESPAKVLFSPLPILYLTAITKAEAKIQLGELGPYGGYLCPCYKYPRRSSRELIFRTMLPSREVRPSHWTLRGVALLCNVE